MFKIEALIWISFWRALKFQPIIWRADSNPRRQSKNIEMKYKTLTKFVHELYDTCFTIQCEELRINHLTLLFVVTIPYTCWFLWRAYYIEDFKWRLHFQLRLHFEGLFWERYILKGQIMFEGHWGLQSWTLDTSTYSDSTSCATPPPPFHGVHDNCMVRPQNVAICLYCIMPNYCNSTYWKSHFQAYSTFCTAECRKWWW